MVALLFATMFPQAVLSMMSLSPPVKASTIAEEFGVPAELTGLYTGLVYAFILAGNLVCAPLIDRWGPIRLSFACVLGGGVGLVTFGSDSVIGALLGTGLMGLCYGPLTPASAQAISHHAGSPGFALIVGIRQTSVPLGGVFAGWLVPTLMLQLGWHRSCAVLGIGSALAGAIFALSSRTVRQERPVGRRTAGRGLLTPLRLIVRRPALLRLSCASMIFAALQLVLTGFLVVYLVGIGHDLLTAGALLGASQVAGIIGRPLWGAVADRTGSPRILLCLLALGMAVSCVLTALLGATGPGVASLPVAILFGATASGWNGVFLAEVMREVEPASAGLATSGGLLFTYAGVVLGPPLFGAIAVLVGLSGAFVAAAAAALAGAVLALPPTRRRVREA
ncbi:MAG: MFS transporter [Pyrinomonadaceae bacterium]